MPDVHIGTVKGNSRNGILFFLFMNIIDNIDVRVSAVRWGEGLPERVLGDGGVDNDRRFGYGMDELYTA